MFLLDHIWIIRMGLTLADTVDMTVDYSWQVWTSVISVSKLEFSSNNKKTIVLLKQASVNFHHELCVSLIEIFKVLQAYNFSVKCCSLVFIRFFFIFLLSWSKMALVRKLHLLSRTVVKLSFLRPTADCGVNRTIFRSRGTFTTQPVCKEQE